MEIEATIVKFQTHTIQFLQPLDVEAFKSLKTEWEKEFTKLQRKKITNQKLFHLHQRVVDIMPLNNFINDFAGTGIYDSDKQGDIKQNSNIYFHARNLTRCRINSVP